jgi:hypothetical protein
MVSGKMSFDGGSFELFWGAEHLDMPFGIRKKTGMNRVDSEKYRALTG